MDRCTLSKLEQAVGNRLRSALTLSTGISLKVSASVSDDRSPVIGCNGDVSAHCCP
jgi:hypothetical protein